MANYSYLLKVLYGNETTIDYEKLSEILNNIDCDYLSSLTDDKDFYGKPFKKLETFEDYANRLDDRCLCGYLTPGTIEKLCKSGLYMKNENNNNPIMYFEEEGWERLHYFKFFPGTEKVEHGTYAFNFNEKYYEEKYDKQNSSFLENVKTKILKSSFDEKKWDYISERKNDYMLNLIYDESTNWKKYLLNYNKKYSEKYSEKDYKLSTYLTLCGLRHEDIINNPEKYKDLLKELKL